MNVGVGCRPLKKNQNQEKDLRARDIVDIRAQDKPKKGDLLGTVRRCILLASVRARLHACLHIAHAAVLCCVLLFVCVFVVLSFVCRLIERCWHDLDGGHSYLLFIVASDRRLDLEAESRCVSERASSLCGVRVMCVRACRWCVWGEAKGRATQRLVGRMHCS